MRNEIQISMVTLFIIFGMVVKIMEIIIFIDTFQYILMLVQEVIRDVTFYFSFILLWVFIFALFYQALGINAGIDRNRGHGALFGYISASW